MSSSGELLNVHSGLALTAKDGSSASKLTLEERDSSTFQSWKATNKLTPVDVYIHGEKNQCIYYNGKYGVYLETCSKGSSRQQWRLYPDSTIRPKDWLDGCMEIASLSGDWIYVQAGYCSGSPVLHKWVFSHDGAIRNWKSQLLQEYGINIVRVSDGLSKSLMGRGAPLSLEFIDCTIMEFPFSNLQAIYGF
ncbi:hypothetical protein Sjap_004721 [Stephania japonica]|uniref:Ricin B lectin domain-containing protein n=1 Tax=Stephania japonica TaxID=461633 RepID=A0AAP0PH90_9MAGN